MELSKKTPGFTLTEMCITVAIVTMMMGYAWRIYFSGRETTRHTISQSQMQSDARIFFDRLSRDMMMSYQFYLLNQDENRFGFYAFQTTRTPLDDIYYRYPTGEALPYSEQRINILKIEYSLQADGTVVREQTPGYLKFILVPPEFNDGPASQYEGTENAPSRKVLLKNISSFQFKGYRHIFTPGVKPPVTTEVINPSDAASVRNTSFIALKIHSHIDEGAARNDEELELAAKFYSRTRLAEDSNPGAFSSVDANHRF